MVLRCAIAMTEQVKDLPLQAEFCPTTYKAEERLV